jgi:hypothetical protein
MDRSVVQRPWRSVSRSCAHLTVETKVCIKSAAALACMAARAARLLPQAARADSPPASQSPLYVLKDIDGDWQLLAVARPEHDGVVRDLHREGMRSLTAVRLSTPPRNGQPTCESAGQAGNWARSLRTPVRLIPNRVGSSAGTLTTADQRLRWSKAVWWAWLDLNQRPHPYQRWTVERCAIPHRRRPMVGTALSSPRPQPWWPARRLDQLLASIGQPRRRRTAVAVAATPSAPTAPVAHNLGCLVAGCFWSEIGISSRWTRVVGPPGL